MLECCSNGKIYFMISRKFPFTVILVILLGYCNINFDWTLICLYIIIAFVR